MSWAVFGHGKRTQLAPRRGDIARQYIEVLEEHLAIVVENDSLFM
jgi:hypothetical protein